MHPYQNLAEKHFWAPAVGRRNMFDIEGLWDPKFPVRKEHKVVTFGSCFAQHIGRALASRGFNWLNTEPAPVGLSEDNARKYNYGVFSSRTGNIYTASLLKQWVGWATGEAAVPDEVWVRDGRYYDPFRPNIEPDGFASEAELVLSRERAIEAFRKALTSADVFVFTLGLTESWFNQPAGYEYPMCPGTVAGEFDADTHSFLNQPYPFVRQALLETIKKIRRLNPDVTVLLTVSPVPLTATRSGKHVLVATMESKSILRAVAGQVAEQFPFVDYFPSYEIINAAPFRGTFFEANQRSVSKAGVDHVMNSFFNCLAAKFPAEVAADDAARSARGHDRMARQLRLKERLKAEKSKSDDVVCEEELLSAFGQ